MVKEAEPLLGVTAESGIGESAATATPQRKLFGVMCAAAFGVGMIGSALVTHGPAAPLVEAALASSAVASSADLRLSNKYTRKLGRSIGNGLYTAHGHLAEAHKATRLELDGGVAAMWHLDGMYASTVLESSIEVVFPYGLYTVTATLEDGTTTEFTVTSKTVRRELRNLETADRESYFDAVRTIYFTDQEKGEELYGSMFKSSDWLVREHLYGAADRECDHWHDDAGIVNHHIGITWQFEQSIQSVDETVAAHYWDYTIDAEATFPWWESPIFDDDWFGAVITGNSEHIVSKGRFAYTPVKSDAWEFSNVTNPYGLLRSPWNTNPTPYLMRSAYTVEALGDHNSDFPKCNRFSEFLISSTTLGEFFYGVNGALHGPVHIMIGGMWGVDENVWAPVSKMVNDSDAFLLLSKALWRQGYIRCPAYCASDAPTSECTCSCPAEILAGRDPFEILNITGMTALNPNWKTGDMGTSLADALADYNVTLGDYLDELCHVGHPGEMFTSAAPQDPTFWPLHGNMERFIQYARVLKAEGTLVFDETWGYEHSTHVPSDTGLVCDWTGIDPFTDMSLPSCVHQTTCPGHKVDDLLPFDGLFTDQIGLYTNIEFYNMTSPFNTHLPYVYDSMDHWGGCRDFSLITNMTQFGAGG